MSRKIKFKIWDLVEKQWFPSDPDEWANLGPDGDIVHGYGDEVAIPDPRRFEVVFFTGLYDKNGKEIYEGDMMEYHSYVVPKGADTRCRFEGCFSQGEVIGNILEADNE